MLPNAEAAILRAIADSESYGLDLVRKSNGAVKMGSVYVLLGRLEDKGLVSSRRVDSPICSTPRRLYRATERGLAVNRAMNELRVLLDAPVGPP